MTFWLTMTLKTHMILSHYTAASGTTPILFHPKWVEAISLQNNEIFFNQGKWWIWVPWLHETSKKKVRSQGFAVLSLKHAQCRFVHGFFTSSSTTKCGFDFEVNQIYLDGKSPIMVQALLCNKLQTQLHVFNKCKQALDCYTWRHDSILFTKPNI